MTDLATYAPRLRPSRLAIDGQFVRVEPIVGQERFGELHAAFSAPGGEGLWRYLPYGPFADPAAFEAFAARTYLTEDPMFHAIVPGSSGKAEGVASLMRIDTSNGVIEIGHICLSPSLKGSRAATEAFFLLFCRVFDELGYRRLEWKCNNANLPSKRAAARLGFQHEGLFRQHMIVKAENRDTAWFSILDREWPALKHAFEAWLSPDNFDEAGLQKRRLSEFSSSQERS